MADGTPILDRELSTNLARSDERNRWQRLVKGRVATNSRISQEGIAKGNEIADKIDLQLQKINESISNTPLPPKNQPGSLGEFQNRIAEIQAAPFDAPVVSANTEHEALEKFVEENTQAGGVDAARPANIHRPGEVPLVNPFSKSLSDQTREKNFQLGSTTSLGNRTRVATTPGLTPPSFSLNKLDSGFEVEHGVNPSLLLKQDTVAALTPASSERTTIRQKVAERMKNFFDRLPKRT